MDLLQLLDSQPSKGDLARAKLIEAAIPIFGEKGLKGATVREIASAAGQNVAAIAYYFGTKRNLYRAVLEAIIRQVRHQLSDVLSLVVQMRQNQPNSRSEAARLLKLFLTAIYLRFLSRSEALAVGRLVIREQMQPSAAFDVLYDTAFREVHETLSFLVGTAVGVDPMTKENIVRTHSLMGQVWFFVVARETILRRLGWKTLEGANAELVTEIFCENLDMIINSLRQRLRVTTPLRD